MQTLNLAHPDEGNLKYVLTKFPDGEPHIKITSEINHKDEVEVYTRICDSDDLFVLLQVGDILKRHEVVWNLHIAYLMSMRMDRVIDFNRPFSLKIVANLINSLPFTRISLLEPHSNVSEKFFYDRLLPYYGKNCTWNKQLEFSYKHRCVVLPDDGAVKRYGSTVSLDNYIIFKKTRDLETGKLTGFQIIETKLSEDIEEFVFVDDLCDGGGTFVGELEVLKKQYPNKKYSLCVRHMVNPIGVQRILDNFDTLYITNSYADWDHIIQNPKIKVTQVI